MVWPDAEKQARAEEVSVWDTIERAARQRRKKPHLRIVALLDISADVPLRAGKRGHFGIPKTCGPTTIRRWVSAVLALPLNSKGPSTGLSLDAVSEDGDTHLTLAEDAQLLRLISKRAAA